jgi:hypothetical protein
VNNRFAVISLKRRPDRLAGFLERIREAWPTAEKRLEIFAAIDGELCPPPDWWRGPPGAFGCWQSHARVIESALMDRVDQLVVFEDDATFAECFELRFVGLAGHVPDDWGMIYLGGQHLKPPEPVNSMVVRGTNINRTHAYVVKGGEPMRQLYRHLHAGEHWRTSPRGEHHIDHHYGLAHGQCVKAYAPRDWLCGQIEGVSDVRSGKKLPARWWPAQRKR